MSNTKTFGLLMGTVLTCSGWFMMLSPDKTMTLILDLAMGFCFINGLWLLVGYIRSHQLSDLVLSMMAFTFLVVLSRHNALPEWLIRVAFGTYCILSAATDLVQLLIDIHDEIRGRLWSYTFLSASYGILGYILLFFYPLGQDLLIRLFGAYFIVLGLRFFMNSLLLQSASPYSWKRGFRISLPPVISAFIPEWLIRSINKSLQQGEPLKLAEAKTGQEPRLKVMVHVGPEGFQKIGHITFSYDGIVYSYGNYDDESHRLNGTIGDGVWFNVPLADYVPNVMHYENNSLFEFGIRLDEKQEEAVHRVLQELYDRSFRWYTRLEREDGYDRFSEFEGDYPSRLHYRTGAKMYKFKRGKYKTYWALGDNCAAFTDLILGKLGADALSIRGIISPGTYLDFLQNEYERPGSPVITRKTYANPNSIS